MEQVTTSKKITSIIDAIRKSPEELKRQKEQKTIDDKKEALRLKEERIYLLNLRWKLCNIPTAYHASMLKPFMKNPVIPQDKANVVNQIKIISQIKTIDIINTNVVFHGAYGKGKTYFATYLVRKMLWEDKTSGFVRAREYCDFKKNEPKKAHFFENIRFLALDEVGDFDMPKWEKMWLKELIISRDAKGFKTLITTNLSVELLKTFFEGRAEDRLLNNFTSYVDFDRVNGACSLRGRVCGVQ